MIRGFAAAVAATVLLLGSGGAFGAQSPRMTGVRFVEEEGRILASGELTLWLTREVKETIDGSLPVTIRYRAEIFSPRRLVDSVVGKAVVVKTMRYDRVKESFLLYEGGGDDRADAVETTNAAEAERWLSTLGKVPVGTVASLVPGRQYHLRLRAEIELSRRSFPLNLLLFFVPDRNEQTPWEVSSPLTVPGAKRP